MKRNLVDIIIQDLSFLKLGKDFYENNPEVLRYFLYKNITAIFGKTEFIFDYKNPVKNEIEIDKYAKGEERKIVVNFFGTECMFQNKNNSLLILVDNKIVATISNNSEENMYQNTIINDLEDKAKISEVQRVYAGPDMRFEYLKSTITADGKIEYPVLRMTPISSKRNDVEYFELTTIEQGKKEKNIIQKIISRCFDNSIVGVQTSYKNENILEYLNSIYSTMEDYIKSKKYTLEKK